MSCVDIKKESGLKDEILRAFGEPHTFIYIRDDGLIMKKLEKIIRHPKL